ncbi:methyltransferase domain-containing protein [Paenibacillus sp. BSR1-1]|uniref:class I SAM-dependent methyltransferase n=1 Tax=Paenibacillus sp. BSR1-1 TaxID=3020845 RepID=UPI0025B25A89|nr:class I SAM-dependent methyltransferase [Paenibacillus sp. BSR1-1]MDN3018001.1 methyltransferase domain-containing protein [Paenibacillus sp. BSR1-1]
MAGTVHTDSWNASLYDSKHSFVSQYGEDLVSLLAPEQGESILDLGCGTGDLANKLHQIGVHIIGIDKSENMVQQAQKKYPEIIFNVQDAVSMPFTNEFDAVFSNATLHWVKEPKQALQGIFQALKQGGRFVAEFGGKGNVQTITDEIINQLRISGIDFRSGQFPWYYPSIGEYAALMEQVGFRVTLAQHFDRPTPLEGENGLRNWIEMFAISMFEGLTAETKDEVINRVEKALKKVLYQNGQWQADYKRIRVVGVKE